MALSIFDEKAMVPPDELLEAVLGETAVFWNGLFSFISETGEASSEWKFYSKKAGWSYVIKRGKRTLLYLIPQEKYFKANFVFGENAVNQAKSTNIPEAILSLIVNATPYMEGRSFMFDIKSQNDLEIAKRLVQIKENN